MSLSEKFKKERNRYEQTRTHESTERNSTVRKAKIEIQEEFDRNMITDEEREITSRDLRIIKQLLISQNKDLRYLEKEQNRLLQMIFKKSLEIEILKQELKQIKEKK